MKKINDYSSYERYFSNSELWNKVKSVAQKLELKLCMLSCCCIM